MSWPTVQQNGEDFIPQRIGSRATPLSEKRTRWREASHLTSGIASRLGNFRGSKAAGAG
jgi:hypothetical protein